MSSEVAIKAKDYFAKDFVKAKMNELLGKNAATFATSVLQCVNQNTMLQTAEPSTIFNAACMAATMNLPINNNLGYAYIVPYSNNKRVNGEWVKSVEAQFQMGYKGFIQLAQRTGLYKTLSCSVVCRGQLVSSNPLTGYEFDWSVESDEVIGYVAYFKLLNGFEAYNYMSAEQVKAHAAKYSQSYQYDLKDKKTNSNWSKNFDSMALKTVIKLLLSKFAPLSVEMQSAFQADQSVVKDVEGQEFDYIDNSIDSAQSEPAALEAYAEEKFESMLDGWSKAISTGRTTASSIIAKIETRNTLTSEQRAQIEALENVIDAAPTEPADDNAPPF